MPTPSTAPAMVFHGLRRTDPMAMPATPTTKATMGWILKAARNASAVSPTLHHTTITLADADLINPLPTMLTRINVTAVALCMRAPATSPQTPETHGVPVAPRTSWRSPPPLRARIFCPVSCRPKKNRPSPRMTPLKINMGQRTMPSPPARTRSGFAPSGMALARRETLHRASGVTVKGRKR